MEQGSNKYNLSTEISADEYQLVLRLLMFIRSIGYGEITINVHTDQNKVKKVLVCEGRKFNFELT